METTITPRDRREHSPGRVPARIGVGIVLVVGALGLATATAGTASAAPRLSCEKLYRVVDLYMNAYESFSSAGANSLANGHLALANHFADQMDAQGCDFVMGEWQ